MTIAISFGIQKGGCSKSTTSGIFTYYLANLGYKVLACDMDCQGNLTELLSNKSANEFENRSILEALEYLDAKSYVYKINECIDLLPANNLLAILPRELFKKYGFSSNKVYTVLRDVIEPIRGQYDFIVFDTPPALSEHSMNALVASDQIIIMFECSQWCYSAIPNFIDSVEVARKLNPSLKIGGIIRTLTDVRRSDNKIYNELIQEDYPKLVFNTIIKRRASTGRLPIYGFEDNKEIGEAIEQYQNLFKELLERVQKN